MYILAAWVALTVSFLLPRVVPGNPVAGAVARASQSGNCNSQCVMSIQAQLGYNVHTSLWEQYLQYLGSLSRGDLGHSWSENAPVGSLILSFLPWTLVLLSVATIISFVAGTTVGTLVAWRRGSLLDLVLPAATFFQAVPYFFLALVMVLIFGQTGTMLRWFPSLFAYDIYAVTPGPNLPYVLSVVSHAILPATTVVLASMAGFIFVQVVSTGVPFVFVALRDPAAVDRAVPGAFRGVVDEAVFVFAVAGENRFYSRMFAGEVMNIPEDPATGSASGPLGAFAVKHGLIRREPRVSLISEQGTKMGRQSFLHIDLGYDGKDDSPSRIEVGGSVMPVLSGTLSI